MQDRKVSVQVASLQLLLVLLAACAPLQPGPDPTVVPSTDSVTSPSPTPMPTSVPPTVTPVPSPVPQVPSTSQEMAPGSEATVPADLIEAIVLRDGELQVTITDVANVGHGAEPSGLAELEMPNELKDTHHFLRLTVLLENIGYQNLLLNTRVPWMALADEKLQDLAGPLECASEYVLCGAPMLLLAPAVPKQLHLFFRAPNEAETFTASVFIPRFEPLKPETG